MVLELLSYQIPSYWDKIKLACVKSDDVTKDEEQDYCNDLLTDLIAGKKRCLLVLDSEKKLTTLLVYQVLYHKVKKINYMDITNAYGFKTRKNSEWLDIAEELYAIARKNNCLALKAITGVNNEKMKALFELAAWRPYVCSYYKLV